VGGSIIRATLKVYNNSTASSGYDVRGVADNTWGETSITYNNKPTVGSVLRSVTSVASGTWASIDVTPLVKGNGLVGLALTTSSSTGKSFGSRESANKPQLVVDSTGGTVATSTPTNTPTATPVGAATSTPTPTPTSTPVSAPTNTPTSTPSSGGTTTTFVSVADAYVDSSNPTVNNGTGTTLRIDGSPVINSYIKFNVSGLTGTVTQATLRVFANSSLSGGYLANGESDSTWGETTLTYSNAPAPGAQLGTSGAVSTGTWTSVTVTGYITGNGTWSFVLTDPSATALSLASRESGANAPQLVITTQ
jgi:hypothetical protein